MKKRAPDRREDAEVDDPDEEGDHAREDAEAPAVAPLEELGEGQARVWRKR